MNDGLHPAAAGTDNKKNLAHGEVFFIVGNNRVALGVTRSGHQLLQ